MEKILLLSFARTKIAICALTKARIQRLVLNVHLYLSGDVVGCGCGHQKACAQKIGLHAQNGLTIVLSLDNKHDWGAFGGGGEGIGLGLLTTSWAFTLCS